MTAEVRAASVETFNPNDPLFRRLSSKTFTINVQAIADTPILEVLVSNATFLQGEVVPLLLNVASGDNVTVPSAESIFAVLSGVPSGTLLSHGFNNGNSGSSDGSVSWSIPVPDLPLLTMTPPTYFSGVMNLTLTGIAREANGDTAYAFQSFTVELRPAADGLLTLAENVILDDATGVAELTLNVRVEDDTGRDDYIGETPPEIAVISFANVPFGVFFRASMGGSFVSNDGMNSNAVSYTHLTLPTKRIV